MFQCFSVSKNKPKKNVLPIILILIFLLQFIVISPFHEFPLNDDWVHTDTIKHWADTGEFRMLPFAGPTFYVPILYGTALVKIFGFSFSLLRISTLVLTGATLMLLYFFLLKIGAKPFLAFIGALTFWWNPLTYNLSFTFMTDIPALFLLLASIYCYYTGFKKTPPLLGEGKGGVRLSTFWLFSGSLLSVIGFFTRQTNILLLVAAGIYVAVNFIKNFLSFRARLKAESRNLSCAISSPQKDSSTSLPWVASARLAEAPAKRVGMTKSMFFFSFIIPLLLGAVVYFFLASKNLLPQSAGTHIIQGEGRLLGHIKWWLWYTPMYLGLFLLPLTAGWIIKHKEIWKKYSFQCLILFLVGSAFAIRQFFHLQFPYVRNMISVFGLGPMQDALAGTLIPLFPPFVWTLITALCAIGAGLLIYVVFLRTKVLPLARKGRVAAHVPLYAVGGGREGVSGVLNPLAFINLFGLLYLVPLLIFESFDRYYLPLLLVFIILIIQKIKDMPFSYKTACLMLIPFTLFGITQTHHYLAWNAARWEMISSYLLSSSYIEAPAEFSIIPTSSGIPERIEKPIQNQEWIPLTSLERLGMRTVAFRPASGVEMTRKINAGYEWNGWYGYWLAEAWKQANPDAQSASPHWWIRTLFPNNTEEYMVSFSPLPGYRAIYLDVTGRQELSVWNPNKNIYLLHKRP
ncbi:MAG: hypothetical protein AAB932_05690 [Patescibacteria group bacterium]